MVIERMLFAYLYFWKTVPKAGEGAVMYQCRNVCDSSIAHFPLGNGFDTVGTSGNLRVIFRE